MRCGDLRALRRRALRNDGAAPARFHWIRKRYEPAPGLGVPDAFVTHEAEIEPAAMPGTDGAWATTRFVAPNDLRHDMHVTIVTMQPGGSIPFEETHVMEHGALILQGKGLYFLDGDWMEVEAGDFIWMGPFCPQSFYATGPTPAKYIYYKNVNREVAL